jgi:hypothetical protein
MTRDEENQLADETAAAGIEFRRRRAQPGFVACGPASVMEEGQIVAYRRDTDLALKRYRLGRLLWEGPGEDGALRRVFQTEYIRKCEPKGKCNRCRMSRRSKRMRCSGTGFHCAPAQITPHTPLYRRNVGNRVESLSSPGV